MCGIFGIVDPCGTGVDPKRLWAGTHAVRHRGPDDWGFVGVLPVASEAQPPFVWHEWKDRDQARGYRVGFGSRRLSILDLSEAGRQPMNLPGTDLWITFNGEIYNYIELRAELSGGRDFTTDTDTEVLLASYEKWGSACLARLNGMFAFAIWDGSRRKLFLARDRFGEKPLYYSKVNGQFRFGSELKQFLEDSNFDREVDCSSLADFLLFSLQDHDERTFLAHVKQLLPAHSIEFDVINGDLTAPKRYWMPAIADDLDTTRDHGFHEQLKSLLEDAIRLRLRSDVRVGVCLSGGIDSTGICSLMASQVDDPLRLSAYTMTFPGFPDDEAGLAGQAASKAGVRHVKASLTASRLWDQLQEFVHYQDGPTGGVSNFASWRVFQTARADGSVVLLNGQGGDELLAGYNKFFFFWFQILARRGQWGRLARDAASYLKVNRLDRWNLQLGRRYFPLVLRKKLMGLWRFSQLDFRQCATKRMDWGSGGSLNHRLWRDLSRFSLPCLLHWEDRNSMSVGTEARLPFLDHRIAEALLATSVYTKLNHGFSKYSLRRAMSGVVPPQVCWQKKKRGFDTPAHDWFKGELASQMRNFLSQKDSLLSEFFDVTKLLSQYDAFLAGGRDTLTHFDWFKLLGTSTWLEQITKRTFALDGRAEAATASMQSMKVS